jgi:hypothetical protein
MKKILIIASVLVAALVANSCMREDIQKEVSVNLSLALPEIVQTKAMSKAELTDIVYYEIWNSDWTKKLYPSTMTTASLSVTDRKATLDLTLVSSQTYNFIFWAQNESCSAYDVTDLKKVKVNYAVIGAEGNQDKFDAFYAVKKLVVTGPINETIYLTRPFAQLNFGANTMQTILGDVTVGASTVTISRIANVFNTINGLGEGVAEDVEFKATGLATDEELVVNGVSYTWVTMDYMLMTLDSDNVEVDAVFDLGMDAPVVHKVGNVPLKKNYRTNIVGDLFTSDAKLEIIVVPDFNDPDEVVTINQ